MTRGILKQEATMKVFRAVNPEVVDVLHEQGVLLDDPEVDGEAFRQAIKSTMAAQREAILALVAVDDDDKVRAYLLAYNALGYNNVFVYHAWSSPSNPPDVPEKIWGMLLQWTELSGKSKIQMHTRRDPNAFAKKWGFSEVATVMEYDLEENEYAERPEAERSGHEGTRSGSAVSTTGVSVEAPSDGGASGGGSGRSNPRPPASPNGTWSIEPIDPFPASATGDGGS